ncbi:MAG TPA: hypothetical protein VGB30_13160 [bacterium]|jgi:hypothetical protein
MRSAFLILSFMLFVGMACSGSSAPVAPDNSIADLPSWTVNVDGQDYDLSLGDLLDNDRTLAFVDPGTDMTADQIKVYFAVNLTMGMFPPNYWCAVYQITISTLRAQPDSAAYSWVATFEAAGYDIPNGPPPDPLC